MLDFESQHRSDAVCNCSFDDHRAHLAVLMERSHIVVYAERVNDEMKAKKDLVDHLSPSHELNLLTSIDMQE